MSPFVRDTYYATNNTAKQEVFSTFRSKTGHQPSTIKNRTPDDLIVPFLIEEWMKH